MFSKPFSLILVYILAVINFTILALPLLIAVFPFVDFSNGKLIIGNEIIYYIKSSIIFLIVSVSFLMLSYLFLDFIFGFSFRSALKGCKRYDQIKNYEFLDEIFSEVKSKFGKRSVKLYIRSSNEINAFAVGSLGRKAIVLTSGMINHYLKNCEDRKEFLLCLRSIMSHEMSHLVNKDFIPGLIIIINQKVTNMVSSLLDACFKIFVNILTILRINNRYVSYVMIFAHNLLSRILNFFNQYVVYNIYEFLRRYISRGIEFRCDKQSALAFGGYNMGLALAFLGESGYFTLFSTHPGTKKRIKKVENIQIKNGVIRPSLITLISNYFSWMILVVICLASAKVVKIDLMVRKYLIANHEQIYQFLKIKFYYLKALL